ncbi:MAG TPA: D-aminoacyl-tRNA deacylase [Motiliproteus sp.]
MLGLIQRVSQASVCIDGTTIGAIDNGILLLLGVQRDDNVDNLRKLLHKVANYRIFPDQEQRMNLSLRDTGGGLLVVSQFTLAADTRKGLRPGFSTAAAPATAEALYEQFVSEARALLPYVACGSFGADMQVSLINDGPVTFMLEG